MFEILVIATLLAGLAALGLNLWSPRAPRRRVRRSPRAPFGLLRALLAGEPDTPTTAEPVRAKQTATRPDDEWRHLLSDEQYDVVRRGRTERPFTGRFWDHREDGAYHCVACGQGLFDSADKYDSGHGWPAFTAPLAPDAVTELKAISYGTVRTEVRCEPVEPSRT